MSTKLFAPGTIVACRPGIRGGLLIWSEYHGDLDSDVDQVYDNDLLLILDFKAPSVEERHSLSKEWQKGAYLVLSPRGLKGWVGAGWVEQVA